MLDLDKIRTYEPILISSGFMQQENLGIKIKMMPFEDSKGSYVKTEDYNQLLVAYKALTEAIPPTVNSSSTKSKKGKHDIASE